MRIAIVSIGINDRDRSNYRTIFKLIMDKLDIKLDITKDSIRQDLAKELDKLEATYESFSEMNKNYEDLEKGKITYIKYSEDLNRIRFNHNGRILTIEIVNINAEKPWRILKDEIGEYIEYWNPYPITVNKETGGSCW